MLKVIQHRMDVGVEGLGRQAQICRKLALGVTGTAGGPGGGGRRPRGQQPSGGGVPGCSTGTPAVGGLAGSGVLGAWLGQARRRAPHRPHPDGTGTAPFVDLELLGPAVGGLSGVGV